MTTITVSEETLEKMNRVKSFYQYKWGCKMSHDQALATLLCDELKRINNSFKEEEK